MMKNRGGPGIWHSHKVLNYKLVVDLSLCLLNLLILSLISSRLNYSKKEVHLKEKEHGNTKEHWQIIFREINFWTWIWLSYEKDNGEGTITLIYENTILIKECWNKY